jgi:hypothetical protein
MKACRLYQAYRAGKMHYLAMNRFIKRKIENKIKMLAIQHHTGYLSYKAVKNIFTWSVTVQGLRVTGVPTVTILPSLVFETV